MKLGPPNPNFRESSPSRPWRIGLKNRLSTAFGRGVHRGALLAMEELSPRPGRVEKVFIKSVADLAVQRLDGLIGYLSRDEIQKAVDQGLPTLNFSGTHDSGLVPLVNNDNQMVGGMAADHLIGLGYDRFGFVGVADQEFSRRRGAAFRKRLREVRPEQRVYSFEQTITLFWERPELLHGFLRALPYPLALFCATDHWASVVAHALVGMGLSMPTDVALLGVDNDELAVLPGGLGLSSIELDSMRVGHLGVAGIFAWLEEGRRPPSLTEVPPVGLIRRQSTDFCVEVDPRLARAMDFIRTHACKQIRIKDVLERVHLSRRHFENQFRKAFGISPYEEILRLRISRAKALLREHPELRVVEIADLCGYDNCKQFSVTFRKYTSCSPSAFRTSG